MIVKLNRYPTLAAVVSDTRRLIAQIIRERASGVELDAPEDTPSFVESVRSSGRAEKRPAPSVKPKPQGRPAPGQKGPRVRYEIVKGRGGRVPTPNLIPTAEKVWKILIKRGPSTAQDIEDRSALPKKTVESCLYALRVAGLVKSVPLG